MEIVVAYARLHYLCRESVERFSPGAQFIATPKGDPGAYPRIFHKLWQGRRDILLIEQDVEIHDRVVPELTDCPEPWCGFEYEAMPVPGPKTYITYGLGCTRFRADLITVLDPVLDKAVANLVWSRLDAFVRDTLLEAGHDMHVHEPPVTHHHNWYPHGCACGAPDHPDARYRIGQVFV